MQSGGRVIMDGPFHKSVTAEECKQACLADTRCVVRTAAFSVYFGRLVHPLRLLKFLSDLNNWPQEHIHLQPSRMESFST